MFRSCDFVPFPTLQVGALPPRSHWTCRATPSGTQELAFPRFSLPLAWNILVCLPPPPQSGGGRALTNLVWLSVPAWASRPDSRGRARPSPSPPCTPFISHGSPLLPSFLPPVEQRRAACCLGRPQNNLPPGSAAGDPRQRAARSGSLISFASTSSGGPGRARWRSRHWGGGRLPTRHSPGGSQGPLHLTSSDPPHPPPSSAALWASAGSESPALTLSPAAGSGPPFCAVFGEVRVGAASWSGSHCQGAVAHPHLLVGRKSNRRQLLF